MKIIDNKVLTHHLLVILSFKKFLLKDNILKAKKTLGSVERTPLGGIETCCTNKF